MLKSILIIIVSVVVINVFGFNLSPKPNYVFEEPVLPNFIEKVQSSYFGYSINLRHTSLLVGAPRTQSSLETQRKVNETGAVYKCRFATNSCDPFIFDNLGNVNNQNSDHYYGSVKKDNQWLGAVMDGHSSENDRFVVCAPRVVTDLVDHYLFHGVCYWTPNTTDSVPHDIRTVTPLRLKSRQIQVVDGKNNYYYMYGQEGVSVHITDNSEEILIGAPGVYNWKGTVIRYKSKLHDDLGGISRRDNHRPHSIERRAIIQYESQIPNPNLWNQPDDSYLGYAVTSAYFEGPHSIRLLYVASAPQAFDQTGKVYIFDYVDVNPNIPDEKTIKKFFEFSGHQIGEYFGYALLAEDFDNDGYVDLAISAPFSKTSYYDNGVVYLYKNEGQLIFNYQKKLSSDYEMNGRFGTALSKIGDINLDGYNDIAIGAPYEDGGVVYIYLGSADGIQSEYSQKITAPQVDTLQPMFGFGLSKGVDIDDNQYRDLAIGAPNAEKVYVYRAYPVVKMMAKISSMNQEIGPDDTSFILSTCWRLSSQLPLSHDVDFNIIIKVDPQLGRAFFADSSNTMSIDVKVSDNENCRDFPVVVKFSLADIFNPINLEMSYENLNPIPDSENYCDNCVAINPFDAKTVTGNVVFRTGCANTKCISDLRITSKINSNIPYILGSSKTLSIEYFVDNIGETAYLPQIRVSKSPSVLFAKIPSNCKSEDAFLLCDIGNGPLFNGHKTHLLITLDTTRLDATELIVSAEVFSTGDEQNVDDNIKKDVIPLAEWSDIEIMGSSSLPGLSLENGLRVETITHQIEVRNEGPSLIKQLNVIISIPTSYFNPDAYRRVHLIDFNNVTMKGTYNDREIEVVWSQNNTILIQNPVEATQIPIVDNLHGHNYDSSKLGVEYDINNHNQDELHLENVYRKRRDISQFDNVNINQKSFNVYTQTFTEHHHSRRSATQVNDDVISKLPLNRTILFDCQDFESNLCIQATLVIYNFKPRDVPLLVDVTFSLDLNQIDSLFNENKDIFVFQLSPDVQKSGDEGGETFKVQSTVPYTIISKKTIGETPLWVYIVSPLVGILVLILMSYGFYKCGFFRRAEKEEMVRLTRESQVRATSESDEE